MSFVRNNSQQFQLWRLRRQVFGSNIRSIYICTYSIQLAPSTNALLSICMNRSLRTWNWEKGWTNLPYYFLHYSLAARFHSYWNPLNLGVDACSPIEYSRSLFWSFFDTKIFSKGVQYSGNISIYIWIHSTNHYYYFNHKQSL